MPASPQRLQEFSATYPAATAALPRARGDLADWLRLQGVPDVVNDELLVVASELLSNAISASQDPDQELEVAASVDDDCVTLEVTNPPASEFRVVDRWDYDDPLRPGGRGLIIVESLVDDLAIAPPTRDRSLSVRCQRRFTPDR